MMPNTKGVLLHGADYNAEQWLNCPDILREDIRLMKKAGIKCVSVGIFSWICLESEEGRYTLGWLVDMVETLYKNGIFTILATPSSARPVWMARKYPEISRRLRSDAKRNRWAR